MTESNSASNGVNDILAQSALFPATGTHAVLGTEYGGPWPENSQAMVIAAGCFWGVEKLMWNAPGAWTTLPGYAGGFMEEPDYRSVCTGRTGHTESVLVVFDPAETSFEELLTRVLENHDPTQGDRQGNDVGPQYRSAVFPVNAEQLEATTKLLASSSEKLAAAGYGDITTEVTPLAETPTGKFWAAEEFHRGYLHKNPQGYCPIHATGVTCG